MKLLKLFSLIGAMFSFIKYKYDRLHLAKLIKNGLRVGQNVYISRKVQIDDDYPYLIEIGNNCRIADETIILAHDATVFRELGITRIAPVKILDGTFIGTRAIILPGVTIGPNAIIAAGSLVNRDIGEGKIAAGNPARPYSNFRDLLKKYRDSTGFTKIFNKEDIETGIISPKDIIAFMQSNSFAFVRGIPAKDPYYINAEIKQLRKSALKAFENLMTDFDTLSKNTADEG